VSEVCPGMSRAQVGTDLCAAPARLTWDSRQPENTLYSHNMEVQINSRSLIYTEGKNLHYKEFLRLKSELLELSSADYVARIGCQ